MVPCAFAFLNPEWVTALATIAYVVGTVLLWLETRKSANAAKTSAEAAKRSADMAAELNRPAIALARMTTVGWPNNLTGLQGQRDVRMVLRNYGNLYAKSVNLTWRASASGGVQCKSQPNSPVFDAAPASDVSINVSVNVPGGVPVAGNYRIDIRAEYRSPDGRWFGYTAARVLNGRLEFEPDQASPDRDETIPC